MAGDTEEKVRSEGQSKTEGETWLVHIFKASGYSADGFAAAFMNEMAFRMEVVAFIILTPLACLVPAGLLYKALVISAMLMVLFVELLNSAMEWVVDYISHNHHPYAKKAKDMGSAAVTVALVNAGLWWGLLLWEWLG